MDIKKCKTCYGSDNRAYKKSAGDNAGGYYPIGDKNKIYCVVYKLHSDQIEFNKCPCYKQKPRGLLIFRE